MIFERLDRKRLIVKEVHRYLDQYLEENILQSETIHRMKHVIREFSIRAPKVLVTKCIDGRVHGSKLKGYPVTTIRFGRTDGNIVSTNLNNFWSGTASIVWSTTRPVIRRTPPLCSSHICIDRTYPDLAVPLTITTTKRQGKRSKSKLKRFVKFLKKTDFM